MHTSLTWNKIQRPTSRAPGRVRATSWSSTSGEEPSTSACSPLQTASSRWVGQLGRPEKDAINTKWNCQKRERIQRWNDGILSSPHL